MTSKVETFTPAGVMTPIGPYSHIARCGQLIMTSATAGVDPDTNELAGSDIGTQTRQVLASLQLMLGSVGASFDDVLHINVFLANMDDFSEMNQAYEAGIGNCRPARSAVEVTRLPKPGALVTMNLTAVIGTEASS